MFTEDFNRLGMQEQENFKRIVNMLLAHTFLISDKYDFANGITKADPDYRFVERNFALFQDYFEYSGFHLERDSTYGVISLVSTNDYNRVHFDKLTTVSLYTLRLIFEETREELQLSNEIFTTTGDLVQKMITLGAITKKPANREIHESLRLLARFQIVAKQDGAWEDADTRILILPTILFVVSADQIASMNRLIDDSDETAGDGTVDDGAADDGAADDGTADDGTTDD